MAALHRREEASDERAGGEGAGLEAAVEVLHDALENLDVGRVKRPACRRSQALLQTPASA